ncbi:MAG: restriction endonuclease subunit S [bacterium]|nr:restriction endonuclease subunit S [bacterium]
MSKLQELIDRLCPDGVEFKPLGEVCEIKRGERVTKNQVNNIGSYPVISGGVTPMGYLEKFNREANTITVAQYGTAGFVNWQDKRFWANDICYSLFPADVLDNRFLYYFLKNSSPIIDKLVNRDAVPFHLPQNNISNISIPIPPLEVQDEIVKILDRFADYAAELQVELQARRLQYEYYRNLLLTFNPSAYGCGTDDAQKISVIARGGHSYKIQWKTMGEIGTFIRGKRFVRTDIIEEGIPCIHYGDMYTYYGLYASKTRGYINQEIGKKMRYAEKNDIVIVAAGENKDDLGNALAWLGEEPAAVHDACFIFRSEMYPNFLSHVCRTKSYHNQVRMFANEAKICSVSGTDLAKVVIPLPPYEIQIRIANILDRFETLVNDLSKGLPAEIEAVKARYEYYRNKLLTFNPLSA